SRNPSRSGFTWTLTAKPAISFLIPAMVSSRNPDVSGTTRRDTLPTENPPGPLAIHIRLPSASGGSDHLRCNTRELIRFLRLLLPLLSERGGGRLRNRNLIPMLLISLQSLHDVSAVGHFIRNPCDNPGVN